MTRRIAALSLLAWTLCALLYVAQPAHAAAPDCTDADRSGGSGLRVEDGQASITFTLARDCGIGLTSYAVNGSEQTRFDAQSATTAGTHTLTVALPPCYQVDFHNGTEHERGEGKAIRFAKDTEGPCETKSTTTTTQPAPTTTTTTTFPASVPSTQAPGPVAPTATSPSPTLAYGGPNPATNAIVEWAVVLACVGACVALVARGER